ncbi:26104_t:CDS:2 [Dentiscutata erythropus]|uniref:26104_t:CDS:1 n=1 Tax=Dentiscutata erythropus TaxID=1348616 RepID=A0A9N8WBF9_9GLOM|nr:26104_t:CDS:2 [Dentiscutata erythropus]
MPSIRHQKFSTQIISNGEPQNHILDHISVKSRFAKDFGGETLHAVWTDYEKECKSDVLGNPRCTHGLVAAILQAYSSNQHLRISPDDIWLTIVQGVSKHINLHSEKYRYRLVKHEGQKEVRISADDIIDSNDSSITGDWPELFRRIIAATDEQVGKFDMKALLKCDFSTSTTTSEIASGVVLLDVVKPFSNYTNSTKYGISKITLDGSLEDWNKLQEKVIQLRKINFDLDFWLDRLDPVIWQFVATYRGEIDKTFWNSIATELNFNSDDPKLMGWISSFFPYGRDGKPLEGNYIRTSDLPDGRIALPFVTTSGFCLKLVSGFVGARQEYDSDDDVVVSPVIGWAVCGFNPSG